LLITNILSGPAIPPLCASSIRELTTLALQSNAFDLLDERIIANS